MRTLLQTCIAALALAAPPLLAQTPRDGPGEIRFNLIDSAAITRSLSSQSTMTFQPCASLTLDRRGAAGLTIDIGRLRSITFDPCGQAAAGVPPGPAAHDAGAEIAVVLSPNPSADGATIEIAAAAADVEIELRILDIRGNVVRRFEPRRASDGKLRIEWDTRDQSGRELPSGAYLIVVGTNTATTSRLLQLAR
jgi:hypothetical protein